MQNMLKGWIADNTVTDKNLEDKILILESAGNATLKDIFREMRAEDSTAGVARCSKSPAV